MYYCSRFHFYICIIYFVFQYFFGCFRIFSAPIYSNKMYRSGNRGSTTFLMGPIFHNSYVFHCFDVEHVTLATEFYNTFMLEVYAIILF